jgi:hypothetical protein
MRFTTIRRAALAGAATVALASGAALAAAPAGAATAHAARPAAVSGTVTSTDIAGWQTTRWLRYNQVTVTLPSTSRCQEMAGVSPDGFGFAVTLGPAEESNAGVPLTDGQASTVGVSMVPTSAGCGLISPSFASNLSGSTVAEPFAGDLALNPGDSVTMSLFYSQGGHFTSAVVTDSTDGTSSHGSFDGTATYQSGSATGGFGPTTATANSFKLWTPKNNMVTTYTGKHATMGGIGSNDRIVMTSNGFASGATLAFPTSLWDLGANFSVKVQ